MIGTFGSTSRRASRTPGISASVPRSALSVTYIVAHQLKQASAVYGFFALVIGLLSWIYIGAQISLFGAEINVVLKRRLWPRSLVQPPLTEADERALQQLAKAEERRPEEKVDVHFSEAGEGETSDSEEGDASSGHDGDGTPSSVARPRTR